MIEKRDNPHAKGLSVNQDVMIDSWPEEAGHIPKDVFDYAMELTADALHAVENLRSGLALTDPEE